jgi:hypothetical protein
MNISFFVGHITMQSFYNNIIYNKSVFVKMRCITILYKRRRGPQRRRGPRFCIFPGYNWCGPGCSGPGAPINAVDAACREHDLCYQRTGDYCYCDSLFIERLSRLQNPYTVEGRHARLMLNYMRIQRRINCLFR